MSARQDKKARKKRARVIKLARSNLDALGVGTRIMAAQIVSALPQFHEALNGALTRAEGKDPPKDVNEVRAIAIEVLTGQFGCDLADVTIKVFWEKDARKLRLTFQPEHGVAMKAFALAKRAA